MTITTADLLLYAGALVVLFMTPGPVWVALTSPRIVWRVSCGLAGSAWCGRRRCDLAIPGNTGGYMDRLGLCGFYDFAAMGGLCDVFGHGGVDHTTRGQNNRC